MNNLDFTLLEKDDLIGKNKLSIFQKYGKKLAITDFAILLGGDVSNFSYTKDGDKLKYRPGSYFTKTSAIPECVHSINYYGETNLMVIFNRVCSPCVVLSYSSINQHLNEKENNFGIKEVEYGEYPQTIVNEKSSDELENLYKNDKLNKTGKEYTTDSVYHNEYDTQFKERKHIEYEYAGKKYIRILGDFNSIAKKLSDGRKIEYKKPYWIKVEPIVWFIDENRNILVSKKLLFTGVQFCDCKNFYTGNLNKTRIKWYLDNCFSKDIVPSKIETKKEEIMPYLVKYDGSDETFGAYELDGILRDIITSLELVKKGSKRSKDTLKCTSKEKTTFKVLKSYCIKDMNKLEYLEYVKRICELGKNNELYNMCLEQIEEEKSKDEVNEYVRNLKNNNFKINNN